VSLVLAHAGLPVQARRWIVLHRQGGRRAGEAREGDAVAPWWSRRRVEELAHDRETLA
jgi:hypothetical protein